MLDSERHPTAAAPLAGCRDSPQESLCPKRKHHLRKACPAAISTGRKNKECKIRLLQRQLSMGAGARAARLQRGAPEKLLLTGPLILPFQCEMSLSHFSAYTSWPSSPLLPSRSCCRPRSSCKAAVRESYSIPLRHVGNDAARKRVSQRCFSRAIFACELSRLSES